ncbi:phosphoribosyltransferase-like protein [Pseudomonas oryzihabitans]|uniref:phosphoribosyltransferase-like protein n=1 Tax=Pseudomonas oryzihabitans TaxID=47885 RepID=UPI00214E3F61|nr:hypothetical protein [Pseudomonas psychrotolerans]UUW70489.1 hypothetical protein NRG74_15465 [Pseudomonas psychrotolerans]
MHRAACEAKLRTLVNHAWDKEVTWEEIESWLSNFNGRLLDTDKEQLYGLFALSRFMYFGKRLMREMLKSLYRDHFASPLRQRIRRNFGGTLDVSLIDKVYEEQLNATRFIGVGNPSESGAHLLYYFRQVNYLSKDLFIDITGAFSPLTDRDSGRLIMRARDMSVTRIVFFDDIVGSGTQISQYLGGYLQSIRESNPGIEIRFMSLFATAHGLEKLNDAKLFNGQAMSLFELDETYKAFHDSSRYFSNPPDWFDKEQMRDIVVCYGSKLWPSHPLGYKDGQLLIGFSHNTPDNVPPIFWHEGKGAQWSPAFIRYHKKY